MPARWAGPTYKAQHPKFELWSQGFHADQEAVRILGESIDYSRKAQAAAPRLRP